MNDLAFTRGLSGPLDATEWALVRAARHLGPVTDKETDAAAGRCHERQSFRGTHHGKGAEPPGGASGIQPTSSPSNVGNWVEGEGVS